MKIFDIVEELEKERKKNKELEIELQDNKDRCEILAYRIGKVIEYINVLKETTPSSPRKDYAKMILINYGDLLDILRGK